MHEIKTSITNKENIWNLKNVKQNKKISVNESNFKHKKDLKMLIIYLVHNNLYKWNKT